MAKTSRKQKKTAGRVMHEYKHGELRRGRRGKGGKVKSRRQAIAIAMNEAGTSRGQSNKTRRKQSSKSRRKEARGKTAQQRREGKSQVGARAKRSTKKSTKRTSRRSSTKRRRSR